MEVVPVTLREARRFIADHHRHNQPPRGWRLGVGLQNGNDELVGVAIGGMPVARALDDGRTLEITRVCTLGHKNASTMLYGAIGRAAKALGYKRLVTYTLVSESGVSLRAAGFVEVARLRGDRSWASTQYGEQRARYERTLWGDRIVPSEGKIRWERLL